MAIRRTDDDLMESQAGLGRKSDGLFGWAIFILLLIGFAFACWMGSFYVFGHPEKSFSYSVLTRLDKLDSPKRFEITAAPRGQFLDAEELYEKFGNLTPKQLQNENEELIRNYIRNYHQVDGLVPYVVGAYNIKDSYEVGEDDYFGSGVVALAEAKGSPNVLLEHVFPADKKMIPALHRTLLTGLDISLKKRQDLSAVVNLQKLPDGRLQVTTVPLTYGSYTATEGTGSFSLDPPDVLNVGSGLPVVKADRLAKADEKYATYKRRTAPADGSEDAAAERPGLMRVAAAQPLNPDAVPAATPEQVATTTTDDGVPVARAVPADGSEPPVAPAVPAESPGATPMEAESPTPSPTPEEAVPLQPFEEAEPTPGPGAEIASSTRRSWPLYKPGQMPRGRLLSVPAASNMSSGEAAAQTSYLQGKFVVSVAGSNRAVLRPQSGGVLGLGADDDVRVIVDFPAGNSVPQEGDGVSRGVDRPFRIDQVERAADGTINIFVREITAPQ